MSSPLVTRPQWGARPPRSGYSRITNQGQTAHYGGPSPWGASADRSSPEAFARTTDHERCASILRAWQAYHMDQHGWNDIAYNSAVCPHQHRFECRGPGNRSAANGTNEGNSASCATVYIAGEGDPLTVGAKIAYLDEAARFGVRPVWDHSDWKSTACAGAPMRVWEAAGWPHPTITPAPSEEDDMPTAQEIAEAVWNCKVHFRGDEKQPATLVMRDIATHARVAAGEDVDEAEVASLVLAGLNAEAIAAAIPDTIAQDVVDALHERTSPR